MEKKSVFGLSENIASLLCYVFGFASGAFFLVMEKENKTVRFNALQSVIWFGFLFAIRLVCGLLIKPIILIGPLVMSAIAIAEAVTWIWLVFVSYTGKTFKMPIVGNIVWEQINSHS